MREDKVMKLQQQGLAVPKPGSIKPDKSFIPDKYKNRTELKKIKRIK